jgi:hypothetical protein
VLPDREYPRLALRRHQYARHRIGNPAAPVAAAGSG